MFSVPRRASAWGPYGTGKLSDPGLNADNTNTGITNATEQARPMPPIAIGSMGNPILFMNL